MGSGEFLFLLKGLQWTLLLSAVGFVGGTVDGPRRRAAAHLGQPLRWSGRRPATSRCSRARRC